MSETEQVLKSVRFFDKMPKWLRVLLIVLSIITIIYWAIWLAFHIWKYTGKALHWISDPRNWWIYTSVILILVVGGLLLAQFCSDIKPFTHLWNNIVELYDSLKEKIISRID